MAAFGPVLKFIIVLKKKLIRDFPLDRVIRFHVVADVFIQID